MFSKIFKSYRWGQPDYKFIAALGVLVVFGMAMLSSASVSIAYERFNDSYYYFRHQLFFGLVPGLILMAVLSMINYQVWRKYAGLMLGVSIFLLILVFIPGIGNQYGSARSWINVFGFSMQPSELVKLTFLIYLATWLENRGEHKAADLHEGLIPFLSALGVVVFLLILQPDTGSMFIIVLMSLVVYFIGGGRLSHIGGLALLGGAGISLLIAISPYRAARVMTFLHPELDPQGIGYHINQAFLALGSGGIFGRGFGLSRQKFQYLPEVMGDSIFAIVGEELGFIICALIIGLFVYFFSRGLKIATATKDRFGKFLVIGIMSWIVIQAFVNIGAMVGLMPLTGVPLPFISYGGTALVVNLAAMGIVINISRQNEIKA